MTSKEALEHICKTCDNKSCPWKHYEKSRCAFYRVIKQELDRLEKLEKENQELKEKLNRYLPKIVIRHTLDNVIPSLEQENAKLKKVIDIFKGFSLGLTMYGGSETSYGLDANNSIILTKEQYELLKEVLHND